MRNIGAPRARLLVPVVEVMRLRAHAAAANVGIEAQVSLGIEIGRQLHVHRQPIRFSPLEYWFQRLTYHSAANDTDFAAFSSSVLIARAGEPTISELSGNSLPSVTSAPAPTRERLPIFAPSSTTAPMPIRLPSAMVQPCSTTLCPMVQSGPITMGNPMSVCSVQLSWMLERSPSSIHSLSPRSTEPHQMLVSCLSRTRPITTALSAIQ